MFGVFFPIVSKRPIQFPGRVHMQRIQTQDFARRDATNGYAWRTEEAAMVNALIGAAWHHEMDQRSGVMSRVSNLLRKVGIGSRRSTW